MSCQIRIDKKGNGYQSRLQVDGQTVFESILYSDRLDLRRAIQSLCQLMGLGLFEVIDSENPRFKQDQKRPSEVMPKFTEEDIEK